MLPLADAVALRIMRSRPQLLYAQSLEARLTQYQLKLLPEIRKDSAAKRKAVENFLDERVDDGLCLLLGAASSPETSSCCR